MIRRSTWIVLVIFAVLVGLALYMQNRAPNLEDQDLLSQEETPILGIALEEIVGLRVLGSDGKVFYAERTGTETWKLLQPAKTGELDGIQLDSDMNQLIALTPLSRLEVGVGIEAVGLLTPTYTIRLKLLSGRERILEVGSETPTASGYYVRVDNTELVVVSKYSLQNVLDLIDSQPLLPTPAPEVTPSALDQGEQDGTETPTSVP